MPTNTYVALATQTLASATASVTFSSIPQGYTDLVLVIGSLGMNATGSAGKLRFNGDTATNYSNTVLYGTGSTAGSYRESNQTNIRIYGAAVGPVANGNNDNVILHIQNYSNTTTNKTVIIRNNLPASETVAGVGLWRSTAAITSINIASYNGTDLFTAGSTFSLYGVAAASIGAKATGGAIYQDATYFYHVFSGNGTFTPTQSISADVLVVAGGGGGSYGQTGTKYGVGGGAGQVVLYTGQSLTATGYTVTVGAGGTGAGAALDVSGGTGGTSTFQGLTAAAAGQGGQFTGTGGASGSGNAGGTSSGVYAGGGAGQGAVGGNASGSVGGAGGIGISTYNSWSLVTGIGENVSGTYYLAGGGAGSSPYGARGLGGGGGALTSNTSIGSAGFPNTGGGASGGTYGSFNAPAGGSGVVIVRYAKA